MSHTFRHMFLITMVTIEIDTVDILNPMTHCICSLLTLSENDSLGDCMHYESRSRNFSKMGPWYYFFYHQCCCHFHHFNCCCLTDSTSVPLVYVFVSFAAPVQAIFVRTGWLHSRILSIIVYWMQDIENNLYNLCHNIRWLKTCIHHSFISNILQFMTGSEKYGLNSSKFLWALSFWFH